MLEHPYIDFDGDGHPDSYDTVADSHGHYAFLHEDGHGHIDAIAYDHNGDGLIDDMVVDKNHDGTMDHVLHDSNHDGYMDTESPYGTGPHGALQHPHIDFNGDGHNDQYQTFQDGYGNQLYTHTDAQHHVDYIAVDHNHDGRIDEMYADEDHDGHLDHRLYDTNGDGYMDHSVSV
jgi:hypothetical protein